MNVSCSDTISSSPFITMVHIPDTNLHVGISSKTSVELSTTLDGLSSEMLPLEAIANGAHTIATSIVEACNNVNNIVQ